MPEAQRVLDIAKLLFDNIDVNKNGRIDPEEMQWLIQVQALLSR